jgi:hypothetical protein
MMGKIRCPTCGRTFAAEASDSMPFCCERCRLVDLGRWLGEQYSVPVERDEEPPEEGPPGSDPPEEF